MKSPRFTNVYQSGSGHLGGAGVGGENKKTGHVFGTLQLGLQTNGAGHMSGFYFLRLPHRHPLNGRTSIDQYL